MADFRVVVEGSILPGFDLGQVQANLAKLIRQDHTAASGFLSGRAVTVKSGVDAMTGERYLSTLRGIGVACHLEGYELEFDADIEPGNALVDDRGAASPPTLPATLRREEGDPQSKGQRLRSYFFGGALILFGLCGIWVFLHAFMGIDLTSKPLVPRQVAAPPSGSGVAAAVPKEGPTPGEPAPKDAPTKEPTLEAATPALEIDSIVELREPNATEKALFSNSAAKDIVAEDYLVGTADLDGDGVDEFVLVSRSSTFCGSGGCETVVLKRNGYGLDVFQLDASTFFGDAGQFAILKASKNGFRLLAEVADGKIVLGDKPDTPLYGKPLVRAVAPRGSV